jgi:hypothetical protein
MKTEAFIVKYDRAKKSNQQFNNGTGSKQLQFGRGAGVRRPFINRV